MGEIRVRNLEDWVIEDFRRRAKLHGRSMEAELREVLNEDVRRRRQKIVDECRALREETFKKHGIVSDSTRWIREDRDKRG